MCFYFYSQAVDESGITR
ncbi:hypothetical protein ACFDC9_21325 [Escherichia coli]|uniref:Uncharacterized protein n=1 Tax=Escherichia coli TaxID=562 RepID=A0A827EMZ3_ECOLX|nr:hypothetical protein [Escherichia coli]EEW1636030.1 hypothetical protein [Escherichia coli]EEW2232790.1 hypothetical protein [Escherichia coli]EEY7860422.1 hypothetical protein [Escherichia coli]EFA4591773.1 hypothetical protein [Escherichia coli]EFE9626922.1 hypothetical protein [Escherichia coli]